MLLFGLSLLGTVVWVFNTEALAVYYASQEGWHPALVGVTCSFGQTLGYIVLFLLGERIFRWSKKLRAKADAIQKRFGHHLERRYLIVTSIGAVIGVPPAMILTPLASGFGVKLHHLVPVLLVCRTIRFTLIAAGGGAVYSNIVAMLQ